MLKLSLNAKKHFYFCFYLSASYRPLKPFMNPHSLLNKIQTLRVSSKIPYNLASEILSRQTPLPVSLPKLVSTSSRICHSLC